MFEDDDVDNETGLDELVIRHIHRILALHNGNQVTASRALGISRSTLRRKLGLS
jgi:DNA-binding protein Fis